MNKAVRITETSTRVVIVDANTYEDAEEIVNQAYYRGDLLLNDDNSRVVDVYCTNDTSNYIETVGEEEFKEMKPDFIAVDRIINVRRGETLKWKKRS